MRTSGPSACQRVAVLDQALITAPASADAEQVERLDERVDRRFRHRFEHNAEQAAGAEKIAFPQGVAGVFRQGRVENARHFRPALQPPRHLSRVLLVALQAHAQGTHAAQSEDDVVRPGAMPEIGDHRAHRQPAFLVGNDRAEHHV